MQSQKRKKVKLCRLCLASDREMIEIGLSETYMLKQCIPDMILDITEKPHRICNDCFNGLMTCHRLLRMWQENQKTLMANFITKNRKINLAKFKTNPEFLSDERVNNSKNKMFFLHNDQLELYRQNSMSKCFDSYLLNVGRRQPDMLTFVLDCSRRLVPVPETAVSETATAVSQTANLPDSLMLVPTSHIIHDTDLGRKKFLIQLTSIFKSGPSDHTGYASLFYHANLIEQQFLMKIQPIEEPEPEVQFLGEMEEQLDSPDYVAITRVRLAEENGQMLLVNENNEPVGCLQEDAIEEKPKLRRSKRNTKSQKYKSAEKQKILPIESVFLPETDINAFEYEWMNPDNEINPLM